jgi:hypothetical protein
MRTVLEFVKNVRDVVTHPRQTLSLGDTLNDNEKTIHNLDYAQIEMVVDASIELASEISRVLGTTEHTKSWLIPRGGDGYFPESAFD